MVRVLLVLKDGAQWVGDLHVRDEVNGYVVLAGVEDCASGRKYEGFHTFIDDEIDFIQDFKDDCVNSTPKQDEENESTKRRLMLVMDEEPDVKDEIVIIDRLNEQFFKAAREISKEKIISLAAEGRLMGRNGKICTLQIKADKVIYIFDMLFLGKEFFQSGLKDIIEDSNILKIMHDCRFVSDALFHTFGVTICNVYDTQVADVVIRRNNIRKIPKYVRDLGTCLRDYLALKPYEINLLPAPCHILQDEQLLLERRPITVKVVNSAADAVRYLRRLRLDTMQRLLKDLVAGTDIYLGHVRDSEPREIALMVANEVPERMKLVFSGLQDPLLNHKAETNRIVYNGNKSASNWALRNTNTNQFCNSFPELPLPDKMNKMTISAPVDNIDKLPKSTSFEEENDKTPKRVFIDDENDKKGNTSIDDKSDKMATFKSVNNDEDHMVSISESVDNQNDNFSCNLSTSSRSSTPSPFDDENKPKSKKQVHFSSEKVDAKRAPVPCGRGALLKSCISSKHKSVPWVPAGLLQPDLPKDLSKWEKLKKKNII